MGFVPQPILQIIVFSQDGLSTAKPIAVRDGRDMNDHIVNIHLETHAQAEEYMADFRW